MGLGPIPAVTEALKRAEWKIEEVDLFEINEAFASQSLAVIKELKISEEIVNVNGGAIALEQLHHHLHSLFPLKF